MGEWDQDDALRRTLLWLLGITVLFIFYASLYPFDFDLARLRAIAEDGWAGSLRWRRPPRTDLIANLLFYMPFGALATFLTPAGWSTRRRFLSVVAAGTLLSLMIEGLQFTTRTRDPSLTDVLINALSTAIAALLTMGARRLGVRPVLPELRTRRPDPIALVLLALWLAFHAAPFMPSVRFIRYFRNPELLFGQEGSPGAMAGFVAGYVLLGAAVRSLMRPASFWPVLATVLVVSLVARITFLTQRLDLDECLAVLLALPFIWVIARQTDERAARLALAVTVPCMVIFMLAPFSFASGLPTFAWMDGLDVAHRSASAEPGLVELAFLYVGTVWLLSEAGVSLRRVAVWMFAASSAIELVQAWQPGKTAHLAGPAAVIVGAALAGTWRTPVRNATRVAGET